MTGTKETIAGPAQDFAAVVQGRHSIRAFLPRPVAPALIDELLTLAARAPSGTNTQPWRVHVVSGAARDRLVAAACALYDADPGYGESVYEELYGATTGEPYLSRKRALGKAMYGTMGIAKGDMPAMRAQQRRNFEFFGAPVAVFLSIDRQLGLGSWLDCGMFAQTLMLAARACGLDTCPQAVWVKYQSLVARELGLPPDERLVCGIALGYADPEARDNVFVSERLPLADFVRHHTAPVA